MMYHIKRLSIRLAVVVVLLCSTGVAASGGGEEEFDAHATGFSYYFRDGDMDFHFGNLVLDSAINGGVEIGEGEYSSAEVQRQQRAALDGFAHPKSKMVVTPVDEGATNHCIMENRSLMSQVLFDWMDDVFR